MSATSSCHIHMHNNGLSLMLQILGRLASRISVVLQGKDKPTYTPYLDQGDVCIVLNAKQVALSGNKLTDKFYRWHTG